MSVTWCTGYLYLLGRLDWRGKSEVATNRKWARVRLERIGRTWEGGRVYIIAVQEGLLFFVGWLSSLLNHPTKNSNPYCTAIIYTLPPSHGLPICFTLTRAHFLLVATSNFPLQSNLPNRYIYPVHHVTDIPHPPAYDDGTDKEFRNVRY